MANIHIRVIPSYGLYGDQAGPAWDHSFNFEWIPQRSRPYQWLIQPHRHEAFLQVLYLTAGRVRMQLDDAVIEAVSPCVLVVPAGHVHGFRFSPDTNGPVVTASQTALESLAQAAFPELIQTIRKPAVIGVTPDMRYVDQLMPLFLALEQEARTPSEGQMAAAMSLLLALMVQVRRLNGLDTGDESPALHHSISRRAKQIERFRRLVDERFRQWHAVSTYARALGVSAGQLTRLCRQVLDRSALQVINERLLHEAQRELIYTTLPIKQLAHELGFEDDAYFSRFFKKHTGLTPKAFRARALQDMRHATSAASTTPDASGQQLERAHVARLDHQAVP
jgi:AraC family transcriptional activator of pobA